jgi:hypothetical protein
MTGVFEADRGWAEASALEKHYAACFSLWPRKVLVGKAFQALIFREHAGPGWATKE